jgi:hypothetical protein
MSSGVGADTNINHLAANGNFRGFAYDPATITVPQKGLTYL